MFSRTAENVTAAAGNGGIGSILESFPAYIAYLDTELVYRYANSRYEALFGCDRADIIDSSVQTPHFNHA